MLTDIREAWEILKEPLKRAAETLEQMAEMLKKRQEPFIEIEEENYTIRLPLRLFQNHVMYRYYDPYWAESWALRNFNPPERWELMQDKRRNTSPLGRNTYLYKARKIKSLARSTHTHSALHKGKERSNAQQCKHTFRITVARCAPCSGYNTECEHYEKNDAADTKRGDSRL